MGVDRRGHSPDHVRLRELLLSEPARPRRIAEHRAEVWLTVATVCVGAFMGQLDASIVNLAFPTLQHSFGASLGAVQWVGLAYLVVVIATISAVGRASDMIGRKLLYTYGFVVFAAGSALCAVAPGLIWLDIFRAVQALGAVMLQANSIAIIASAIPRERLGRAIGAQGTAQALGLALGPVVGGVLIGVGGWRLIFVVNVPIGVVGAVASWLLVPRSRNLGQRVAFDWAGLAMFMPALAALLLGLSFGNQQGWTSPQVLGLLAVFAVLGIGFVARQISTTHPMIDLGLFRVRRFAVGTAAGLLSYLVLFGVLFVTPFELERARGMSPARAGIVLTILPVGMAIV
ncbi:MAG TPA: MFS transporter, partial [Gaiellales bacterium]|nr:MFS transporter [Gaiellales bacterium]